MHKLYRWRTGIPIASAVLFVLVIPSLPPRRYHLYYWAAAFVIELVLILLLRPSVQSD